MIGADADRVVTFFMQIPDPQHHGAVPVKLRYDFLDLEFNITTVANIQGYETSDWISFVDRR